MPLVRDSGSTVLRVIAVWLSLRDGSGEASCVGLYYVRLCVALQILLGVGLTFSVVFIHHLTAAAVGNVDVRLEGD